MKKLSCCRLVAVPAEGESSRVALLDVRAGLVRFSEDSGVYTIREDEQVVYVGCTRRFLGRMSDHVLVPLFKDNWSVTLRRGGLEEEKRLIQQLRPLRNIRHCIHIKYWTTRRGPTGPRLPVYKGVAK
jgi:hypothetical protein